MKKATREIGNIRLLKLAEILEHADEDHRAKGEPTYYQGSWTHGCGTPACALGHWAANNTHRGWANTPYSLILPNGTDIYDGCLTEFDIGKSDVEELFGGNGCGGATTAAQAAAYIRKFVERRCKINDEE